MTKYDTIKKLRAQNLTLAEIGERLGYSTSYISRILNQVPASQHQRKYKGVSWDKLNRRYSVRVAGNFVGYYKDLPSAVYVRNKFSMALYGFEGAERRGLVDVPPILTGDPE